jgi:hypothetical protein
MLASDEEMSLQNQILREASISSRTIRTAILVAATGAIIFVALNEDQRHLFVPASVLIGIGALFITEVWSRERVFPLFEIGAWTVTSTTAYTTLPLIQHLVAGMEWTILSDNRLLQHMPSPHEFGSFAWNYVFYLLSFSMTYLALRANRSMMRKPIALFERGTLICAVALFVVFTIIPAAINVAYGIGVDFYGEDQLDNIGRIRAMPLILQQIRAQLLGARTFFEIIIVTWLCSNWRKRFAPRVVYLWLSLQIVTTLLVFGSRTELVVSLLVVVLAYHRLQEPLSGRFVAVVGVLLLAGVISYGLARDYMRLGEVDINFDGISPLSASNEFMAVYATGYDVHVKAQAGGLPPLPLQAYFNEVLMLIPQQILPFQKLDPSEWYLEMLGAHDTGVGFMWGVVSSAAVGFGVMELIVRGAVLGIVFGLFHRWCARRSGDWRVVCAYMMMCLWAYYTYRATTFYFLVFLEYRFVVPLVFLAMTSQALRRCHASRCFASAA